VYCDTAYAFKGGLRLSFDDIFKQVSNLAAPYICITGGEPLAQPLVFELMTQLADKGYKLSLETSGAFCIKKVDKRVKIIWDVKTPASGEVSRQYWDAIGDLKEQDEIKFVLSSRDDYDWALGVIKQRLSHIAPENILLSPSYQQLSLEDLANWMVQEKQPYRLQHQFHKTIWGEKTGV
jgi:7-carboxy-7-deazaguanine synthase